MIVQIGKYYLPEIGGIENNVRQVAHAASHFCDSAVLCMRKGHGERISFNDVSVQVIKLRSFGCFWRQEITESPIPFLNGLEPDILQFHSPNPLLAYPVWLYLRKNPHVRLVISHHADLQRPGPVRSVANLAFLRLLERADTIISYTRIFAEQSREISRYVDKVTVLPHGVAFPSKEDYVRDEIDISRAKGLRVGFLGRLEAWKGVQILFKALKMCRPETQVIVAGDGTFHTALKKLAEQLQILGQVEFMGHVSGADKEQFFSKIDVLALPSLNCGESYGQALVEAQLRQVPVIASDLPTGVREICDYGRTGLLFPPGNAGALAGALKQLENTSTYRDLAGSAYRRAVSNYSEQAVKDRLKEFYLELIEPLAKIPD